jgi:ech hydrogenase subunit A
MEMTVALIIAPLFAAAALLLLPGTKAQYAVVSLFGGTLVLLSVLLFFEDDIAFAMPPLLHNAVVAADVVLLLFFVWQGVRFSSPPVTALALLQLLLFAAAEALSPAALSPEFIADDLSKLMFGIVNIVGTLIVLYAVRYMAFETMSPFRKRLFLAYLFVFLSVMNTLVIANSILLFFFLFEMTTLASYLLIRFRQDEVAQRNALRALWMNQVGGAAILLAALIAATQFHTLEFDVLLASSGDHLLLGIALLCMAAFVKAAAMPFDGWLLGAMVAPTPVSAMLHSATMVKIAPFMILKFSPVLTGTLLGGVVSATGALVFAAAAYLALSRELFKEILGYSTIALLGLMMSLAAVGTEAGMQVAMVLMGFHALSKALLFLSAGVLEKHHGMKRVESMKGLIQVAPKSVAFIILGFVSLTLPPFGIFMGKLFAIELIASQMEQAPWLAVILLGIVVGSIVLTLLYFKIVAALLSKGADLDVWPRERLTFGFGLPLVLLASLILAATASLLSMQRDTTLFFMAIPLAVAAALPWLLRRLDRFDRTGEYHCGEKEGFDAALFYYGSGRAGRRRLYLLFGLLFAAVGMSGVFS